MKVYWALFFCFWGLEKLTPAIWFDFAFNQLAPFGGLEVSACRTLLTVFSVLLIVNVLLLNLSVRRCYPGKQNRYRACCDHSPHNTTRRDIFLSLQLRLR